MKTFIIDLIIFALIMVVFLVGLPRQEEAPLMKEADVVVARPGGGVKLHERIVQSGTGNGIKVFSYADQLQNSYGTVRWQLRLMGTFEEQDGKYVCTGAQHETLIYNTLYYEKDAEIVIEGDTVTCILTMGMRLYGIPLNSKVYEITLTCGPDGTLS